MNYVKPVFRTHLSTNCVDHELRRLLSNLAESATYIKREIERSNRGMAGSRNQFGEEQMALDVLADRIILDRLNYESTFGVMEFASEEQSKIVSMDAGKGRYSVTVDPLDGSSLVDVNLSIGSIFGVHDGPILGGRSGESSLVAAMYVLYGPETTLVYSAGKGAHEFILDQAGNWVLNREHLVMKQSGKIYGPGGLPRDWMPGHVSFVRTLEKQGKKLRYSGALVADVNHIVLKGGGIFSYPALRNKPHGKLRLLFELQPLAMIVEKAGGMATDGSLRLLDKVPSSVDERSPAYIGSKQEVRLAQDLLLA